MYSELHCLSNFSFLRGASHPEELVQRAAELGYTSLAITDECSLAGVVRAHLEAKDLGLKIIIGSEFELDDGLRLILLAQNLAGYQQLSQLITQGRRAAEKGEYHLTRSDLEGSVPDCLALWLPDENPTREDARWFDQHFRDRCWLAVELLHGQDDNERLQQLLALGDDFYLPCVAAGNVHMHLRSRRFLQDVLTAIRLGQPVGRLGKQLFANGERHLRSLKQLKKRYPPQLLAETQRIDELCQFSLDELKYQYPHEICPKGQDQNTYLRQLTEEGMTRRWPEGTPEKVVEQVEKELSLIAELGYAPYFLTVYDIVAFARSRDILCQGRGSAANSAVCYCLGITEVDPSRMSLLFERFISKERNEPPDIDVDFENARREEVIQYIYQKYGRDRAALAATVITYRPRSALRDVGKALGLDLEQVDRLAKSRAWWDGSSIAPERLREAGFDPDSRRIRQLLHLVQQLLGFPRHLSQHVGGFVIADQPLIQLVPVENAAMPDRTIIQWDKDDLDAMGLLKVDVLALGMLTAIRKALELLSEQQGRTIRMQDIPAEDPAVYRMLQQADAIGVFQVESRAQLAMLPRLKPENYYDLVVEISLVRPGPIQGDMVHPYLRRRNGEEAVTYPSPQVKRVLERTLGIPIFQEQVIELAMVAAGFSGGEADQLRRSMAAWRRSGSLEKFEHKLRDGMLERGYSAEFAARVFEQIKGFGEYGFPESHAASFALLVYVSAWLKCHHPATFTCGLLNSQPMGFYAPSQLVQDVKRHDVEVRPVDVLYSQWDHTLEFQHGIASLRLGLRLVKGLSKEGAEQLLTLRQQQKLQSVQQLSCLNKKDLQALANGGALKSLAGNRHQAHWQAQGVEEPAPLFADTHEPEQQALPLLAPPSEGQEVVADYRSLGLTLGRHPMALLRPHLEKRGLRDIEHVRSLQQGQLVQIAGLVISRQRPGTASGVTFVTLEDEHGTLNVIVWSDLGQKQRSELLYSQLLGVIGTVERQGDVIHLLAGRLTNYSQLLGQLEIKSRNFR